MSTTVSSPPAASITTTDTPTLLTASALSTLPSSPRVRSASLSSLSSLSSSDDSDSPTGFKRPKKGGTKSAPIKSQDSKGKTRGRREKEVDDKTYLVAGLYWNEGTKGRQVEEGCEDVDWKEMSGPSRIVPLPMYYGDTLLSQERPFRLPFDIIRDCYFDKFGRQGGEHVLHLVGEVAIQKREKSRKPDPFGNLTRNVYVDRKADKADVPAICMCRPVPGQKLGCGGDCINRMMQYSCDPKTCPMGNKCSNPPLGQQAGIPVGERGLRVIWTGNRGFGLKTMVPIKKGTFILQYLGEIISRDESYNRVLTTYASSTSYYFLDYDGDEVIDAGQRGNVARFINHACGPNTEVVRWRLSNVDEYQMGIFALEDIPPNTELSYNYGWKDFSSLPSAIVDPTSSTPVSTDPHHQRCFCGSSACTGWLGMKQTKKPLPSAQSKNKGKKVEGKRLGMSLEKIKSGRKVVGLLVRSGVSRKAPKERK